MLGAKARRVAEWRRSVTSVTDKDGPPALPRQGVDPVTALTIACELFASHVDLLADQLAATVLDAHDAERVRHAVNRAVNAAGLAGGLAVGLQRHVYDDRCQHHNLLTDAKREPFGDAAALFKDTFGCDLQPGHGGPHLAFVYERHETYRGVWIRWDDRSREFVTLPYCPAALRGERPDGVDDESCGLFQDHAGAHSVGFWASSEQCLTRE
jgi:hypothetical protein